MEAELLCRCFGGFLTRTKQAGSGEENPVSSFLRCLYNHPNYPRKTRRAHASIEYGKTHKNIAPPHLSTAPPRSSDAGVLIHPLVLRLGEHLSLLKRNTDDMGERTAPRKEPDRGPSGAPPRHPEQGETAETAPPSPLTPLFLCCCLCSAWFQEGFGGGRPGPLLPIRGGAALCLGRFKKCAFRPKKRPTKSPSRRSSCREPKSSKSSSPREPWTLDVPFGALFRGPCTSRTCPKAEKRKTRRQPRRRPTLNPKP